MWFLQIHMAQVVEILSHARQVSKFGFNVHGHNIGHIAQLSPNQVD